MTWMNNSTVGRFANKINSLLEVIANCCIDYFFHCFLIWFMVTAIGSRPKPEILLLSEATEVNALAQGASLTAIHSTAMDRKPNLQLRGRHFTTELFLLLFFSAMPTKFSLLHVLITERTFIMCWIFLLVKESFLSSLLPILSRPLKEPSSQNLQWGLHVSAEDRYSENLIKAPLIYSVS